MTCKQCQGEPAMPGGRPCRTCDGCGQVCDGCRKPINVCDGYCVAPPPLDESEMKPPEQQAFCRG